jgi:CRP-like cAMP-binding protein
MAENNRRLTRQLNDKMLDAVDALKPWAESRGHTVGQLAIAWLLAHPRTALQIMESMADRFISLVSLTADLSLRTVEARFAKLLLEQAEGDVIERRRWTTQTELAAHLGTVPDVLSRVTRELTKAGLITMDKQHIRILDRAGLAERAMLQGK